MRLRSELVTPPAEEPVTTAQAKAHLRVEIADDDAYVAALVASARGLVEHRLRRALITQTWDAHLERWPYGGGYYRRAIRQRGEGPGWLPSVGGLPIELPWPRLQSVSSISYRDTLGAVQTVPTESYLVTPGTPGRIDLAQGAAWPNLSSHYPEPVTVRFVAGYGAAAAVPQPLKQAILLLVGQWYQERAPIVTGTIVAQLPYAVEALLATEDWGGGYS